MPRRPIAFGLIALALLGVAGAARAADILPGEIVVRFRSATASSEALRTLHLREPAVAAMRPTFAGVGRGAKALATAPADAEAARDAEETLRRTHTIVLAPGTPMEDALREFRARDDVEFAAPIRLLPLLASYQPDDPELDRQWHHDAIGSRLAWARTTGDPSVVIAIVDTGLDLEHADLAPNLWVNPAEANGLPGVDDDGNGYVDDRNGYDFTDVPEIVGAGDYRDRDPDPNDDVGHGTWVAGMAAAAGDNGVGGAGVAFGCRLMPLRAGFQPRSGFSLGLLAEDDAAAAIIYAADNGADVVNLSFGDLVRAPILEEAVRYALARGVIVVAAAGNNGDDAPFYPAAMAGVLAVGASTQSGTRASFSTFGPAVRLLAPGSNVLTTERGGGLVARSGTSLAAPVAAGAAALLRHVHPDWPAARVVEALLAAGLPPGSPFERGAAHLRVDRAMDAGGDVTVEFTGLEDGTAVADTLVIVGTAAGGAVRGWRLLVRPESSAGWSPLAASTAGHALNARLAAWPVTGLVEGPWRVRLEALGLDAVVGFRETRVIVDRTPPVVVDLEILPTLTGDGFGLRAAARADEPVLGRLRLTGFEPGADPPVREFLAVAATTRPILGLDESLLPGRWRVDIEFDDLAGNRTALRDTLEVPDVGIAIAISGRSAPSAATWLPRVVDLDGDGRGELVGESWERGGGFYGRVRAWRRQFQESELCSASPGFAVAWTSDERFIPRDFGDFDGDGWGDLLGQGLQSIRVIGPDGPSRFPNRLIAASSEAWASRFVPSADGTALEIVASRDSEIRLYRHAAPGLELVTRLVNPTDGLNAISPAIERLLLPGGGVGLATIDSDGDLLVAERTTGDFAWRFTTRRAAAGARLAAADVDGDGISELALLEAVGDVPSPAAGLRDGYLRLTLLERRAADDWATRAVLGVAGHFPGNPTLVQGVPARSGAAEDIWVGAAGRAWRLLFDESTGNLRPVQRVDEVGDGPIAWGRAAEFVAGPLIVFPSGSGASEAPDDPCFGPMLVDGDGVAPVAAAIRGLRARATGAGDGAGVELRWDGPPGAVYSVGRWPIDAKIEFVVLAAAQAERTYRDSTAEPGRRYGYVVTGAAGAPIVSATIELLIRPRNPIVAARFEAGLLEIEWTDPVRVTESTRIDLAGSPGFERLLPVADGRSLMAVPIGREAPAPGTYRVTVHDLVSESGLDVTGDDSETDVTIFEAAAELRLVRAWPVDETTVGVELDPGVPLAAVPLHFEVNGETPDGDRGVVTMMPVDTRRLHLGLAAPLRGGDYQVRLEVGAAGAPAGEVPFRLGAVVYPNPVRAGFGSVRFEWLTRGDRVRVFDLTGRELWSDEATEEGLVDWPLTGAGGDAVAPGIYLFRVEGTQSTSGKIAVIR